MFLIKAIQINSRIEFSTNDSTRPWHHSDQTVMHHQPEIWTNVWDIHSIKNCHVNSLWLNNMISTATKYLVIISSVNTMLMQWYYICQAAALTMWYEIPSLPQLVTPSYDYSGERFRNTYQLLNLRALKISTLYKNRIFQCMGKIFCVEFQRVPLKFHTKYLTHTLNDMIFIQHLNFKSSYI